MQVIFTNACVIDGIRPTVWKNTAVIVEDATISWVGPIEQTDLADKSQSKVIDLAGKTLMPGLMDVHVHICQGTTPNPIAEYTETVPFQAIQGVTNANAFLDAGFTTVRSLGAFGYPDIAVKEAINQGLAPGPRILASGEMVMAHGSGEQGFLRPEVSFPKSGRFTGVEGARQAVRTQIYNGADVIKLIASGRVGSNAYTVPWDTEMTRDEMAAVCDEAHRFNRKVAAHAYSSDAVTDCTIAGVDSIEHGVMIDESTIELMAKNDTALVPTMTAFHNYLQPGAEERFPAYRLARGRPMAEIQQKNFSKYLEYGLTIATGSDGPRPGSHPGTTGLEIQLMVKAGMSTFQAVQAATSNASKVLGLTDKVGTIEVGKLADLIVVDGDPLADISILQNKDHIQLVMKNGEIVRSGLD